MAAGWWKLGLSALPLGRILTRRREKSPKEVGAARRRAQGIAATPFQVSCACGQTLKGMRQLRRQILKCSRCNRLVFVLPTTPWAPHGVNRQVDQPAALVEMRSKLGWTTWQQPLRMGAIAMVLAALLVTAILLLLDSSQNRARSQDIRDQAELARQALDRGVLADAHTALAAAERQLHRMPKGFPPKEASDIHRLFRQVELIATLLMPSLEELVIEAKQTPEDKWFARFTEAYTGKAVVFDAVIFPGRDRRIRLDYELQVDGADAGIELNDIAEFSAWVSPNQDPQRWLFGLRLSRIDLSVTPDNPDGLWVVRFQPDSMELITEPALLRFLDLPPQRDVREALARQRRLVHWEPSRPTSPDDIQVGMPGELLTNLLGPPLRSSRQILAGRYLEQRYYDTPHKLRILLARPRGGSLRVTRCERKLPILQNRSFYSESAH